MNESRYRLVRPLAVGGMAELYLGVVRGAEGFEKPVAIKRVLPHLAREPAIAKMFLLEARLATHLQHQNIASVYDVGTSAEGLFLVMELVNGWDLGILMRQARQGGRRFPPHLVAFIGTQVLAGLAHAYRRQHQGRPVLTAHRDVSPSNILISREGEVKVADFGIARVEGVSSGTQPGTFKGKLPYSSPETLHGEPATALSDQFSLGIVLYELLAGRHPFTRPSGDPMAMALAIAQQPPPPLEDAPAPLRTVLMRALANADQERYPRPEDMAEALSRYLGQSGESASSHSLATFIAQLAPPPTLLEQGAAQSPPGERTLTHERPSLSTRAVSDSFALQSPPESWDVVAEGPLLGEDDAPARTEVSPPPALAEPVGRDAYEKTYEWEAAPALELETRAPRQASDFRAPWEPRPWRERLGRAPLIVGALVLVVGALVWGVPPLVARLERQSPSPSGAPAPPRATTLFISSEPAGATVTVDGTRLGTTPLAIDNLYPARDVPLQLTLKGYKPWKGVFRGGQPATLEIELKR